MIRINLLPYRERQEKEKVTQYLVLAGAALGLVAVLATVLWIRQGRRIATLEGQVATARQELEGLKQIARQAEEYEKKLKLLQKKVDLISQLKESQQGPVHILDEISLKLSEDLWLISVADQDGQTTLDGYSLSHEGIARFMKSLEKSKYFSNVELLQSKQENEPGTGEKVLNFTITLKSNAAGETASGGEKA